MIEGIFHGFRPLFLAAHFAPALNIVRKPVGTITSCAVHIYLTSLAYLMNPFVIRSTYTTNNVKLNHIALLLYLKDLYDIEVGAYADVISAMAKRAL